MTTKQPYNYEYLQQFCQENNIILLKDYSNEKITVETYFEGDCKAANCIHNFIRDFRSLIKNNGFCKSCARCNGRKKKEILCLEKYGVKHFSQTEEFKEKTKQTCLQKYGCEHSFQTDELKEKTKHTLFAKYGVKHFSQTKEYKEKTKQTCLQKYGCENPFQNEAVREKAKQTCLQNYGCENAMQNEEVKEKTKQTCFQKYGCENPFQNEEVKEKWKTTNKKLYGHEYPLQNKQFKEKSKQTCLQNWGVEHPSQNSEISEKASKNSYHSKEYTLPSGKIIKIQGYENYMLDELLQKENILEEDIITSRSQVPTIWYLDDIGKKHRYYVDVFIPSQNRMIECKSTWTMKKGIEKDNIYLKQQACKDAGYSCEIWVYNSNGEKVECIL